MPAVGIRRIRAGDALALAGAACVIVSLLEPWYEGPRGTLDAWDTFGAGVVLLILAALRPFRALCELQNRSVMGVFTNPSG